LTNKKRVHQWFTLNLLWNTIELIKGYLCHEYSTMKIKQVNSNFHLGLKVWSL
jgi:hypothetical protein